MHGLFNDLIDYSLILDWINVSHVSVLLRGVLWFWRKNLGQALSIRSMFINEKLNSTSTLKVKSLSFLMNVVAWVLPTPPQAGTES